MDSAVETGDQWLLAFFSTSRVTHQCPSNLLSWQERTADRQCGECNLAPIHNQISIDKGSCHAVDKLSLSSIPQFQRTMGLSQQNPDCRRLLVVPRGSPVYPEFLVNGDL